MYFPVSALLIEFMILSIVNREDSYGYEISQTIKLVADIKESTLYPILKKLEKAGYVTTYSAEYQGRKRKYYSITEAGKTQMAYLQGEWKSYRDTIDNIIEWRKKNDEWEYLKQLEKYLRKLPQSDYEDAMEYFTEYFADAGPENEQAVIKELGTPKQAAAELMRNLLDKKVDEREAMEKEEKQKEKKKTTGANVVWIAILALFAAPIGAPILISILIVLLCAALCAALLDMSVFLIAVVGVAAGIKMLLRGILAVSVSFGGFCFITGMGVFMLGISILCAVFGVYFAKWMGRLFVWVYT